MCYSYETCKYSSRGPRATAPVTLNDKSKLGLSTFIAFYGVPTFYNITLALCVHITPMLWAHRNSIGFESNLFAWFSTGKVSATENINTTLWLTLFYYQNCLWARAKKKWSSEMKSIETVFGILFDCNQICLACVKSFFLNLG